MKIMFRLFANRPASVQWVALMIFSMALGFLFLWLGIPAALLLGPMLAGIVLTGCGGALQVPRIGYSLAQGFLGCMIAKMLPLSISKNVINHWPLFVTGVFSVIAASGLLGWLMTRLRLLPGTTVVWGLSPGAATAMTVMAENYGADVQLVAVMQYLRVIMVATIASVVAHVYGINPSHAIHNMVWFPAMDWSSFAGTLALAISGIIVARWLRFRAGALLIPLVAGIILVHRGWMTIELPHWLLAICYAFIGWRIGLCFTQPLILHAAKALPRIAVCTLALIALCGGIAALLVFAAGIDPLTAYLSTSPGGADSMAIIAASSHADTSFIMAMQMARFVAVLIFGPPLARFVAKQTAVDA